MIYIYFRIISLFKPGTRNQSVSTLPDCFAAFGLIFLSDLFGFFTGSISDSESDGNSFALVTFGLAVDFGGRPRFLGTFSSSELSDFTMEFRPYENWNR